MCESLSLCSITKFCKSCNNFKKGLNIVTVPVPTFKIHNVGTVPTFTMYTIGTVPTFRNA